MRLVVVGAEKANASNYSVSFLRRRGREKYVKSIRMQCSQEEKEGKNLKAREHNNSVDVLRLSAVSSGH